MQLILNDEDIIINHEDTNNGNLTVSGFIDWLIVNDKVQQKNFAIAVNMEFVPRSLYSETFLKEEDRIEIVLPMQGG